MKLKDAKEIEYETNGVDEETVQRIIENSGVSVEGEVCPEPEKLTVRVQESLGNSEAVSLEVYPPENNPLEEISAEGMNPEDVFESKKSYAVVDENIDGIHSCMRIYRSQRDLEA